MKKLILLLSASSIALSLNAQENKHSVIFSDRQQAVNEIPALSDKYKVGLRAKSSHAANTANKTTAALSRWYNYGQYLDTTQTLVSGSTGLSATIIWNDTTGQVAYTSGLAHNTMVSNGAILHPQIAGFNDPSLYPGEMAITATNAYVVDSINIVGLYLFNPAKTGVVDTLTLTFTYGDPLATSSNDILQSYFTNATVVANYGLPTGSRLVFGVPRYDSVTNTAAGASKYTMKIPLTSSMWGDTTSGGLWVKTFGVAGVGGSGFAVPAGQMLAYSMSFKTGDATYTPNATIEDFTGAHTYNIFRPIFAFNGTSSLPVFAPYDSTDYNSGQFKRLPNYANGWGNVYVPMYAWTSGGGASTLQHSFQDIHITCATCSTIGAVNEVENTTKNVMTAQAYPNPAVNELNVKFTTAAAADVTVNLINTLGQVVAAQTLSNVTAGTASFNTSKMAAGVYSYTVNANGSRSTGRVVVAH